MKLKRTIALLSAAAFLSAAPAALADTAIVPTTEISGSTIGQLDISNYIKTFDFGSGTGGYDSQVIAPVTVLNGVNAAVANIINNIIVTNVNIDMSDLAPTIAGIREDIMKQF